MAVNCCVIVKCRQEYNDALQLYRRFKCDFIYTAVMANSKDNKPQSKKARRADFEFEQRKRQTNKNTEVR